MSDEILITKAEILRIIRDNVTPTHDQDVSGEDDAASAIMSLLHDRRKAKFQSRVATWMMRCFGTDITNSQQERAFRFAEEAGELVQSIGMTEEQWHDIGRYVWGRPVGDTPQEVGGVMVTLAALCHAARQDMDACGETELARINTPDMIDKIRRKHNDKKLRIPTSALPGLAVHPNIQKSADDWATMTDEQRAVADHPDKTLIEYYGNIALANGHKLIVTQTQWDTFVAKGADMSGFQVNAPLPGNYDTTISETARDLGIPEDQLRAGRDVALLTPEQRAD